MKFRFLHAIVLLLLLTTVTCRPRNIEVTNQTTVKTPTPELPMLAAPEILFTDFLKQEDMIEMESKPLLRAWKRVPDYEHYRIARAPDFNIPEWVANENEAKDLERAINDPYKSGPMSGAMGLAAIIIDKRVSEPKRFSCVLFISRPSDRYDIYWIFKNEDLSHFTMRRHSGDVYLQELREDRTRHVCDLQYSRTQKRWACEFYS